MNTTGKNWNMNALDSAGAQSPWRKFADNYDIVVIRKHCVSKYFGFSSLSSDHEIVAWNTRATPVSRIFIIIPQKSEETGETEAEKRVG